MKVNYIRCPNKGDWLTIFFKAELHRIAAFEKELCKRKNKKERVTNQYLLLDLLLASIKTVGVIF